MTGHLTAKVDVTPSGDALARADANQTEDDEDGADDGDEDADDGEDEGHVGDPKPDGSNGLLNGRH